MSEQFDEHGHSDGAWGSSGADWLEGEAQRVLSAVQDWAARTLPDSAQEHANGTCQWCPICQFVAVLRGERPDVTARVAEAGSALMTAFRAFVDATMPPAGEGGSGGAHREQGDPARPRVQRIDLRDDPRDESGNDSEEP